MEETWEEFFTRVAKKKGKGVKKFKVSGSWGVYDAYKLLRKHKWLNIGRPLKEHEFYSIIRGVNNYLAEEIANGKDVVFPARMGKLELRKFKRGAYLIDGKLVVTYPIDWNKTIKLWYEDEEAYRNKNLIRNTDEYRYKIIYKKYTANYENKMFYEFEVNRDIWTKMQKNVAQGKADTIW